MEKSIKQLTKETNDMLNKLFADMVRDDFTPEKILKNGSATIVFWKDGSKTIVKRSADDAPDDYAAFTAALAIKIFGSNSGLKKVLKDKTVIQQHREKKKYAYPLLTPTESPKRN